MSSLLHHYNEGGWAMHIILFWLIMGIAFTIERGRYLYRCRIDAAQFVSTLQKCILAGDIGRAIKVCSASQAPLGRIVKAGLLKVNRPDEEVQSAMDEEALKELPKLEHRTAFLGLFANLSMLCGLFGTVIGLINSFGAVGGADASSKATILAQGISEAMNCTAFGLGTAIVNLIAFGLLNNFTSGMIEDINAASVQVLNLVVSNRSKVDLSGVDATA